MLLFHQSFLSIIDCFNVFSRGKVILIIQSPNLVYRVFYFEMYSIAIKMAIDLSEAQLLAIGTPILGLKTDIEKIL